MKTTLALAGCLSLAACYPVYAAPTFCTGVIDTVTSGQQLPGSFFLTGAASTGNCVLASDKWIGGFSTSGAVTGAGTGTFTFQMPSGPANVQIGITGTIGASTTGTIDYSVAVDPALSNLAMIEDLGKDFTLGAQDVVGFATATLTGTSTATSFQWNCTRTVNPSSSGACPQDDVFGFVSQMTVDETITTGANAVVTGLTDTISQAVPSTGVPEPGSLAMLGSALMGFVWFRRRRT